MPGELFSGSRGQLWEQMYLPLKLSKSDILWSPSNVGPIMTTNQVVTIHDVVPFDHPEWLNNNFVTWYKFIQPILVKKVKKIITISNFSKERIIDVFGVREDKVEVVYNGVSQLSNDSPLPLSKLDIPYERYILSVGSLEPRKNLISLIEAWGRIKNIYPDVGLVIVGAKGVSRIFKDSNISNLINERVMFTGHLTDQELHSLYSYASCFCYPSFYEGFGLPPLEAMLYKIPVITSSTTAMKELCENRAILIEPKSIEDIAQGIRVALDNDHSLMTDASYQFASQLTWDKCAENTLKVLND
jgi:glycosyltransferase involved in cell wall biosynthesis